MTSTLAFLIALSLYGIACGLFMGRLAFGLKDAAVRAAQWVFGVAVAAHTFELGWNGAHGHHPGSSWREATSFAAWLLAGIYVVISSRNVKNRLAGAFVAPVVLFLEMAARFSPVSDGEKGTTTLGRIHITLAMAGVAVFMAATAAAVLYLVKAWRFKHKKRLAQTLQRHGMPLEAIDGFQHRLVSIGFPIFTMALLTGAAWVSRLPGGHAAAAVRPEYAVSMVTWTAFAVLLGGRVARGWHGRRSAILTVVGFVAALTVLGIYMFRRVQG